VQLAAAAEEEEPSCSSIIFISAEGSKGMPPTTKEKKWKREMTESGQDDSFEFSQVSVYCSSI
jgi:hypothetical protein